MLRAKLDSSRSEMTDIVTFELFDTLPLSLVKAREAVMIHFRNMLRRYSLTEPQWRVLKAVGSPGAIDFSELSRITVLLLPSLSRIVRELEVRGYIHKQAAPTDLRRMQVRLTPRGSKLVQIVSPDSNAVISAMRGTVGCEKLLQLQQLLAELDTKLSSLALRFGEAVMPGSDDALIMPGKRRGRPRKKMG